MLSNLLRRNKKVFIVFGVGQKNSALRNFSENAPLLQHAGSCFVKGLCLDLNNVLKAWTITGLKLEHACFPLSHPGVFNPVLILHPG